jgi:hypothetical protein
MMMLEGKKREKLNQKKNAMTLMMGKKRQQIEFGE